MVAPRSAKPQRAVNASLADRQSHHGYGQQRPNIPRARRANAGL